jgi:hypothetical protein
MIDVGNTLINVDPATGNRINGEMRDDVVPQDGTGTPVEETLHNDLYYSLIAIMNAAGITADDSEEGAVTSQVMKSLDKLLLGAPSRVKFLFASDYTILDTDTFNIIFASASGANRTITFPLVANNIGKRIKIFKSGGPGNIIIVPNAADANSLTTYGLNSFTLVKVGDSVEFQNQTSFWADVNQKIFPRSHFISSINYTILDSDGFQTIAVSTGVADRTVTLPLLANNEGRRIRISKVFGPNKVIVSPDATDTNSLSNDALSTVDLVQVGDTIEVEGTNSTGKWEFINERIASQLRLHTYAGVGSVETAIIRFTTVVENYGNYFIENHSTGYNGNTEGLKIIIQRSGKYGFSISGYKESGVITYVGLSLNTTNTTQSIISIPATERLAIDGMDGIDGRTGCAAWTGYLQKGDIIRAHVSSAYIPDAGSQDVCHFTASYLGN